MNEAALVSVIVPVYQVESYIRECLDTIVGQTYRNLEIILVDDGSTDRSGLICDEYAQRDPRISVIHQENRGLGAARNAGLDRARGEWIYFADSDDYLETDLVERVCMILQTEECDMCVFGYIHHIGAKEEGRSQYQKHQVQIRWETKEKMEVFLARVFFLHGIGWEAWNRFYKRAVIEQHGLRFVDERRLGAEDLVFCYEYILRTCSAVWIPDRLYHYRIRSGSIISQADRGDWTNKMSMLMEFLEGETTHVRKDAAEKFWLYYCVFFEHYFYWTKKEEGLGAVRQYMLAVENAEYRDSRFQLFLKRRREAVAICGQVNGRRCRNLIRYLAEGRKMAYRLREMPINLLHAAAMLKSRIKTAGRSDKK